MKTRIALPALIATFLSIPASYGFSDRYTPGDPNPADGERRPVDLVICLDTSGSMTPMIDSARGRLWDVVNELSKARPMPRLRIGLLTYGTPQLSTAAQGWVVRQIDLTDDLDSVYAKMMAMSTSGGDEFVGWVLNDAVKTMSWSSDPRALRLVFVAGNESADQAAEVFNFRYVAEQARSRGITINAIYGGGREQGMSEHWHEVAQHGGGSFTPIDMQCGTIQISTPQDDLLIRLNVELNATYVPYGVRGAEGCANQQAQDGNAERMGRQSTGSRIAAKCGTLYTNTHWDLVDACDEKEFRLSDVKSEELPENMRNMTVAERQAYVDGMKQARGAVQKKIQEASQAREEFLKIERRKLDDGKTSLDDAMLRAIREQAQTKGFTFE